MSDDIGNDDISKARFQKLLREVEQKELQRRNHGRTSTSLPNGNIHPQGNKGKWNKYRWLQFGVYLWAGRLGMAMIGGTIPTFFAFFSGWFTGNKQNNNSGGRNDHHIDKNNKGLSVINPRFWMDLMKEDFASVQQWRQDYQIQLIREVPVISPQTIELLFRSLSVLPHNHRPSLKIKKKKELDLTVGGESVTEFNDDGRYFSYFTDNRHWSTHYQREYEFLTLDQFLSSTTDDSIDGQAPITFPSYRFLDSLNTNPLMVPRETINDAVNQNPFTHYMYLVYPHLLPYLESFAPSLALIAKYLHGEGKKSSSSPLQASLWMASPNVSAVMHYDLDDNFLLQLFGDKTVVVASPEAVAFIKPYPSLHPLWRQSSIDNLVKVEDLATLRDDFETEETLRRELEEFRRKRDNHKEYAGGGQKKQPLFTDLSSKESDKIGVAFNRSIIWQVDLSPGDMLYIPAGYFHAVITGEDSVSVNAWFGSALADLYNKFAHASLPFLPEDPVSSRLSDVVGILRQICLHLNQDRDCLSREVRRKYDEDLITKMATTTAKNEEECPVVYEPFCTKVSLQAADSKSKNKRVGGQLYSHLEKSRLSATLKTQALLDYVDDLLVLIVKDKLLPCTMETLIRQCFT